jgi:hypothetical protein
MTVITRLTKWFMTAYFTHCDLPWKQTTDMLVSCFCKTIWFSHYPMGRHLLAYSLFLCFSTKHGVLCDNANFLHYILFASISSLSALINHSLHVLMLVSWLNYAHSKQRNKTYCIYKFSLLTHSWSWVLLEKPPIVQLLKNFPAFYGTRRFITLFTRALHLSLSQINPILYKESVKVRGFLRIFVTS